MDQHIPSSSVHLDIQLNSSKNNNKRKYHGSQKFRHFKCKRRARGLSEEEITELIYRRNIDHQNNTYRHLSTIMSRKFQKLQKLQKRLSSKMHQEQLNRRDQNVQIHASLTIQQQRQRHQRRSIEQQQWIQQQQQARRRSHEYHTNYNDIEMMMISDDNDDDLKEKIELLHMHDFEEMNSEDRRKQEQLNQLEEMFSFKMETNTE